MREYLYGLSRALVGLAGAVLLVLPVFISSPSSAVFVIEATWNGGGADSNWSTAVNWTAPAAPPEDARLIFPAGAARLTNNNDLPAGRIFEGIDFEGDGGGYVLGGNAFGLREDLANEGLIAVNTAGTNTINNDIKLAESQGFTSTVAGTSLVFGGVSRPQRLCPDARRSG